MSRRGTLRRARDAEECRHPSAAQGLKTRATTQCVPTLPNSSARHVFSRTLRQLAPANDEVRQTSGMMAMGPPKREHRIVLSAHSVLSCQLAPLRQKIQWPPSEIEAMTTHGEPNSWNGSCTQRANHQKGALPHRPLLFRCEVAEPVRVDVQGAYQRSLSSAEHFSSPYPGFNQTSPSHTSCVRESWQSFTTDCEASSTPRNNDTGGLLVQ